MIRRTLVSLPVSLLVCALFGASTRAMAADESPDALIKRLSAEVLPATYHCGGDNACHAGVDVNDRSAGVIENPELSEPSATPHPVCNGSVNDC